MFRYSPAPNIRAGCDPFLSLENTKIVTLTTWMMSFEPFPQEIKKQSIFRAHYERKGSAGPTFTDGNRETFRRNISYVGPLSLFIFEYFQEQTQLF